MAGRDETPSSEMKHLDKELARTGIGLPRFGGERYEDTVPDTLDLAARAELAISAVTRMLDPERDYLLYCGGRFNRRPPALLLHLCNPGCAPKHLEALPLLRIMSGSTFNIEVDKGFMESMLHKTGKDGCVYIPASYSVNPEFPPLANKEPFADVMGEGRHILALCMWYQHDRNPLWASLIERKIKRLTELAVQEKDYAYFPRKEYVIANYFAPGEKGPMKAEKKDLRAHRWSPKGVNAHSVNFCLARSLCVYYNLSGYEPALELAGKIIRGVLKRTRGFDSDGRWLLYHFHTCTASLLAILEYALITKNAELLELVRKGYEYGKAAGDTLTGFFPEFVPGSGYYLDRRVNLCETCEVADMIGLALKLTLAGVGDYWEDVDRWTRNQLAENQLTRDKFRTILDNLYTKKLFEEKPIQPWESDDVERGVGGFAGKAFANDWGVFLSHACCTANAGRTLYWIWDSILTKQDDEVRVNLLLNRASPWLDINSYLPYEGKVVLKVKEAKSVAVRIPQWTDREKVDCALNGKKQQFAWSGNYVEIKGLKAGDAVTVEFPMREESLFREIGRIPYKLTLKGNTVVDIDPKSWDRVNDGVYNELVSDGELCPLYQRDHYRQDKAPMKKLPRFVSNEIIKW